MNETHQQAMRVVRRYALFSAGAGLIPIHYLDLAAISGVQLKMLAEVSKIYDVPFQESRGKAVVGSLVGSVVPASLSFGTFGSMLKAVPVVGVLAGTPAMVLFCGATAWSLGKVFIQHYESGGTFLNFEPDRVREYFKSQFEEGRNMAAAMKTEEKAEVPV